jgi:hypothetical protein
MPCTPGEVYIISYLSGEVLSYCRPHQYPVVSLHYCPSTHLLTSCGKYGLVNIHAEKGEEER